MEDNYILYTDGGFLSQESLGSFAYILIKKNHDGRNIIMKEFSGLIYPCNSPAEAEIKAVHRGLDYFNRNYSGKIKVVTDSEYCLNCVLSWSRIWKKFNWVKRDGTPVKNKFVIQDILRIMNNSEVTMNKIKSRSNEYNIHVDDLCTQELYKINCQ